jgi:cytochrome c5
MRNPSGRSARARVCAAFSAAVLLASCGRPQTLRPAGPTAAELDIAARAEPQPPALAALYDRSCKTCHGLGNRGAPLVGRIADWVPRIAARGADGLLASVKKGRGAMPPGGICPDCSDDDDRRIIAFMSGAPK